jgi:putative tricarboxylic transport membrane protein
MDALHIFDFITQYDFHTLWNFNIWFAIMWGSVFGMLIGALPGLGSSVGCALMIPLTYHMDARSAIIMLLSVFTSCAYGDSISSIVLGIPGGPAAVVTCWDGVAMTRQGKPGKALGISLYSSFVGGLFGCVVLIFLTGPLAVLAIKLADPELFLIGIIGLVSVATLGGEDPWRCFISILLGLAISVIGIDPFTGISRFAFGNIYLGDGISLIALLIGFYALTEVFEMCMGDMEVSYVTDTKNLNCKLTWKEFKEIIPCSLKAGLIGTIFGIVPGLGGGGASTVYSYMSAKRSDPHPEEFGHGSVRGLATAESANNGTVGGGMVPLLSLGIPSTATMAIIAGALMMQGIQPGPNLMKDDPNLVYTVYWGLIIATFVMFIIGRYTTSLYARILICPNYVLIAVIDIFLFFGAFVSRRFMIDMWTVVIAGFAGFLIRRLKFAPNAFVLAYVLSDLIENRFRRSMMLSRGSFSIFFTRPACLLLWVLLAYMIFAAIRFSKKGLGKQMKDAEKELGESLH